MQQDWRRDPIWQLLGIIISIAIALITQFSDNAPKLAIAATTIIACGWVYGGNKYLIRVLKHPVAIAVLKIVRALLLTALCCVLFFVCLVLFIHADNLLGKLAAGVGCIVALSASVTVFHSQSPFFAKVLEYTGFLTGAVGVVLVFVVDNVWVKVVLGIGAIIVELTTFFVLSDQAKSYREVLKTELQQTNNGANKSP